MTSFRFGMKPHRDREPRHEPWPVHTGVLHHRLKGELVRLTPDGDAAQETAQDTTQDGVLFVSIWYFYIISLKTQPWRASITRHQSNDLAFVGCCRYRQCH